MTINYDAPRKSAAEGWATIAAKKASDGEKPREVEAAAALANAYAVLAVVEELATLNTTMRSIERHLGYMEGSA